MPNGYSRTLAPPWFAGEVKSGAKNGFGMTQLSKSGAIYMGELTAEILTVLPTGEVTGKSTAQTILVSGKMNQSTTAMQSLVVDATGVITGEIAYGDLEIRRGGELLGSITQINKQSKLTK